ncbi:hypothetical protein GGR53DRAFT_530640 [Hypoxylon sp. FL1150]|nr:hypothetical protein GGR53DRAFT_530640 [Hypoxylon sp. FL1150]
MACAWPKPIPKLEAFPRELIQEITKYLGPKDIGSLRLTHRNICGKASYRFAAYFEHKTLDLLPDSIFEFIYLTRISPLARRLKHLTLQAHVYSNRTYRRRSEKKKKYKPFHYWYLFPYLVKAFQNLRQFSSEDYGLSSLTLRVVPAVDIMGTAHVPEEFRSYRSIWNVANQSFSLAMKALWKAQMPVRDHLDIFGSNTGCSLRYDAFMAFAEELTICQVQIFRSLKRLTISLSLEPEFNTVLYLEDALQPVRLHDRDYIQRRCVRHVMQVIMHGLTFMNELEDLDFHWYSVPKHDNEQTHIATNLSLPDPHSAPPLLATNLKTCTLRGLFVSGPDLLHFLQVVRPTTLALEYISLTSGHYAPILQYVASQESGIKSYYFDDLRKQNNLMHFAVPGEPKFPWSRTQVGPSTLRREGIEVKKLVRCQEARGIASSDNRKKIWEYEKLKDFGGFAARYYNFTLWNTAPIPGDKRKMKGGKDGKKKKNNRPGLPLLSLF